MKGFSFLYISLAITKATITIHNFNYKIVLLLLLTSFLGLGQDGLLYDKFSVEDGLPSNQIYQTIQDDNGDLWICSDNGLIIFDGINRRSLTTIDGLPDNTMFKVYKDSKNRLWFTTYTRGMFWIRNDSVHIPDFNESLTEALRSSWIDKFYIDSNDSIWMSSFHNDTVYYQAHVNSKSISSVNVHSSKLCMDEVYFLTRDGKVIISGTTTAHDFFSSANCLEDTILIEPLGPDSLVRIPIKYRRILYPKDKTTIGVKFKHRVYYANEDDKLKWLSIRKTLYKMVDGRPRNVKEFETEIIDLYLDENYLIVSVASRGIYVFDAQVESLKLIGHYFKTSLVSHTYRDNLGYYWLSIVKEGLIRVSSFEIQELKIPSSFSNNRATLKPWFFKNDSLRIVTKDSLFILRPQGQSFKLIGSYSIPHVNDSDRVHNLDWDEQGRLYYIFYRWDYSNSHVDTILRKEVARPRNITVDDQNHLIYWGDNGYQVRDPDKILFTSSDFDFDEKPRTVLILEPDHHLVAGLRGLHEFKDNAYFDLGKERPEFKVRIEDLKQDSKGRVWMATRGSGVYVYTEDSLRILNTESGLSSNFVVKIWILDGEVYVATNNGLNRIIEEEDYQFSIKSVLNMQTGGPWYVDKVIQGSDGIVAHGVNSIAKIGQKYLDADFDQSSIIISGLEFEGNSYLDQIEDLPSLDYDQNNFQVFFRTNSLKSQLYRNLFRYRLKGLSSDWQTTTDSKVRFIDLQPASYEFEVQARSSNGQWSESFSIPFMIQKPIYKRNWFIASILLFGLALSLLYLNLRRRQEERSKELIFANIRALKNQMNPHFIFNALNSIQYYMATNQKREANIFLSKLSDLVRNILNTSNRATIPVEEELGRIKDYLELEKMRLSNAFEFQVRVEGDLDQNLIQIPPMLIQPIAENAIWHGLQDIDYPGELNILFKMVENDLIVEISDNGQGMDIEKWESDPNNFGKGNSIGLANILRRMELMTKIRNKDFQIAFSNLETTPRKGTKITLTIPQ